MQLGSVMSIAASGLRAQTQRLAQSAQNVANVNTDGYEAARVETEAQADGGVAAQSFPTYAPHGLSLTGQGQASNTDLVDETVTQLGSAQAFKANLAVLRTADDMLGELVSRRA